MTKFDYEPSDTSYKLKFLPEALVEWNNLDGSIKKVLRNALKKRLNQPRTLGAELHGDLKNCYKIKLLKQGYRLIYSVEDQILVVLVIAIDKREKLAAYRAAIERLIVENR